MSYRIPVEETFSWQRPVISILNDAPNTPSKGDRYIVGTPTAADPWETHDGEIAWYDGSSWQFDSPSDGWITYNKETDSLYIYDTGDWAEQGGNHGDMTKAVYDTDDDGIVDKAESLDDGGGNTVTAAQAKEAYDRRGQWDSDLGCILMEI